MPYHLRLAKAPPWSLTKALDGPDLCSNSEFPPTAQDARHMILVSAESKATLLADHR